MEKKGDLPGAFEKYREAAEQSPEEIKTQCSLAAFYEKYADYLMKEATKSLDKVFISRLPIVLDDMRRVNLACVNLAPKNYEAYARLGNIYMQMGDVAEADAMFSRSLTLNPRHAPALEGKTYLKAIQDPRTEGAPMLILNRVRGHLERAVPHRANLRFQEITLKANGDSTSTAVIPFELSAGKPELYPYLLSRYERPFPIKKVWNVLWLKEENRAELKSLADATTGIVSGFSTVIAQLDVPITLLHFKILDAKGSPVRTVEVDPRGFYKGERSSAIKVF
ncbi:MAG: tetratricopeptide repeat protein [Elusimicrobia bacterium]|nr:tetratricopeptide repeat protein [Elusimicrobiota bacterium]